MTSLALIFRGHIGIYVYVIYEIVVKFEDIELILSVDFRVVNITINIV